LVKAFSAEIAADDPEAVVEHRPVEGMDVLPAQFLGQVGDIPRAFGMAISLRAPSP